MFTCVVCSLLPSAGRFWRSDTVQTGFCVGPGWDHEFWDEPRLCHKRFSRGVFTCLRVQHLGHRQCGGSRHWPCDLYIQWHRRQLHMLSNTSLLTLLYFYHSLHCTRLKLPHTFISHLVTYNRLRHACSSELTG